MKKILPLLILLGIVLAGCATKPEIEPTDIEAPGIEANTEPENLPPNEQEVFVAGENTIFINPGSEWELRGILTLPAGEGTFPVVIVVPASGPVKRFEYNDLAEFLAEQGIAAIRYDKRAYAYSMETINDVNFTLKEASLDDALSAVALAKTIKEIDSKMIFVLGHSEGGFLIPKINEEDKENIIAGYISMAGSAASYKTQAEKMISFSSNTKDLEAYAKIINLTAAERGKGYKLVGQYPSWWLYAADYDPAESAKNIEEPIFFLQGTHDLGLLPDTENLDTWKLATQNNPQAVYKLYPGLNHFFRKTEELGGAPIEPIMDEEVLIDIANFIKSQ